MGQNGVKMTPILREINFRPNYQVLISMEGKFNTDSELH